MSEFDLAKYPGLYPRPSGVWYVRKRVPRDLMHLDARWQIRLSLETSDRKTAIKRYPLKLAEIEAGFEKARAELAVQGMISAALTRGKLELLGQVEIEKLVSEWWDRREGLRRPQLDGLDDPAAVVAAIDEDASALAEPNSEDGDPAARLADRLLVSAGITAYPRKVGTISTAVLDPAVKRNTRQYSYLRDLVRRALLLEGALAKDHILARHDAPYDALFNPTGVRREGQPIHDGPARSVKDLIDAYRAERVVKHGKEPTERKYGLLFRVMEEVLGSDLPVSVIDHSKCIDVLAFLRKLPPNATKRFPDLTLSEAVAKASAERIGGLAPNTVGSYMQNLVAILRWARKRRWGVDVDTDGLVGDRRPRVVRRSFEKDELEKLFAALQQFRDSDPTKFWVPALALYSGARAGEICQLRTEDVQDINGIMCLNLSEFDAKGVRVESKRLKTPASERFVPLHPALLAAGFMDFVDRADQQGRLFPDLKRGPKDSYSHDFSKWFGRFKRRVGFDEPALVFHSFRHGLRDACRDADIPEETALALGGWATIYQAQRYGKRGAVPNLDRAMRKLKFGGFTLAPVSRLPPARKRTRPAA